jgi:hypothetical protein
VRRGAKAVQPQALAVGEPQSAIADQPSAEQRRRREILEPVGNRKAEALVRDAPLRVAAVDVVAGEARVVAEVLAAAAAVAAGAVRPREPRDAEPPAVVRDADDLVPEGQRQLRPVELAVDDVEIGPADPAGEHAQQHLSRRRVRNRHVLESQWLAGTV